jgi:hypothetical protein
MSIDPVTWPQPGANSERRDNRLLRVLVALHYLAAVITACFAFFGWRYIGPGRQMLRNPGGALPPLVAEMVDRSPVLEPFVRQPGDRPLFGAMLLLIGAFVTTLSLVHACALAYIGRCIARRRRRGLCIGFSIFDLTYLFPVPIGAGLGVFALIMLFRPGVVRQFQRAGQTIVPPTSVE